MSSSSRASCGAWRAIGRLSFIRGLPLSTISVLVGGSFFIASAVTAIRHRLVHLEIPIALGIVLAYAGSVYAYFSRRMNADYFDTLNVFIALMLVGRFLQQRAIDRNRNFLLAEPGVDRLFTRRQRGDTVELIRCGEIAAGDNLVIAPGDLVPVDAIVEGDVASVSLDWINGESRSVEVRRGEVIPAGGFSCSDAPIRVRATMEFSQSALVDLLRAPVHRSVDAARTTAFWKKFTSIYVFTVLGVAAGSFSFWLLKNGDLPHALEVTTAILIVTCPCALGLATPLAYQLVQANLRRVGLYVRSERFLDRACDVRRVIFDKTGTLTTGELRLSDSEIIGALGDRDAGILRALVSQSNHPKSLTIARALASRAVGGRFAPLRNVREAAGWGIEGILADDCYRVGRAGWADTSGRANDGDDVVFSKNGEPIAHFQFEEQMRQDAKDEILALKKCGFELSILSGDSDFRVKSLANELGIAPDHAFGSKTPREKAEWLAKTDRNDSLMIGDGVNDALVVESAFCSGTPAIDRPFIAARSDFYFVTPGLRPVRFALSMAKELRAVVHRNVAIAIAYNVVMVALAASGNMSPLLCAVAMPLSSLSVIALTVRSLSFRNAMGEESL